MTKVFIDKATYDPEVIKPIIGKMLDSKGPDWIKTGTRVLVKPNLLLPSKAKDGIVTHPQITRCVVEYLLDKGAEVVGGCRPDGDMVRGHGGSSYDCRRQTADGGRDRLSSSRRWERRTILPSSGRVMGQVPHLQRVIRMPRSVRDDVEALRQA